MNLCKDCRWFQPLKLVPDITSKYGRFIKITKGSCGVPMADVIYGDDDIIPAGQVGLNTAYSMRYCGPCGFEGRFFQPIVIPAINPHDAMARYDL